MQIIIQIISFFLFVILFPYSIVWVLYNYVRKMRSHKNEQNEFDYFVFSSFKVAICMIFILLVVAVN